MQLSKAFPSPAFKSAYVASGTFFFASKHLIIAHWTVPINSLYLGIKTFALTYSLPKGAGWISLGHTS